MDRWLWKRTDLMAELLAQRLRHHIPSYRELSDEILGPSAHAFVEHFLAALRTGDADPLLALGRRNLERRFGQGPPKRRSPVKVPSSSTESSATLHVRGSQALFARRMVGPASFGLFRCCSPSRGQRAP